MSDELKDAVNEFSDAPNMEALHQEYDQATASDTDQYSTGRLNWVERIRYARWPGQHEDGLAYHATFERAGRRALYDGAPDTRIQLADDIINYGVALDLAAFWSAQIKTSPIAGRTLNAAQAGELRCLINWLKYGPLKSQLDQNVEIAAQLRWMIGWCVLHPTWRNCKSLKMQRLTMEEVFQMAAQAQGAGAPPHPGPLPQGGEGEGAPAVDPAAMLAHAPEMVMDPEQEDAAVELFLMFFPDLDKREARRVVRELREQQVAEFPSEETSSVGPELGVLVPGYQFVLPLEATARPNDMRVCFVIMDIPKWRVDQLAAEEDWTDPKFVELLKNSAGDPQRPPEGKETDRDTHRNMCRLAYAFRRVVKDGAQAVYCTVMSPNVKVKSGEPGAYGKDWNIDLAHREMPFKFLRLEAADWCITDTRGVCDMVFTQQNEMKQQRDGVFVQSQLSNTPPIQRLGTSASKLPPQFGPFAIINAPSGKPWEVLNLTAGSKPELAIKITADVRKEAEDKFGMPREDTPAARSQLIQQKLVNQGLAVWGEAFHQLAMLAYQNMSDQELEDILGHKPLLTAEIVARHKITLMYDTRAGDGDFLDRIFKFIPQIIALDSGGLSDHNKLARWLYNYIDPSLADEITTDESGAKQKIFRETREEINNMALGNKPLLTAMDPTARMKMAFAKQVIASNQAYQMRLTPKVNGQENPNHDPVFFENFQTYMKNLQHSYQETTLSKVQGRLGVEDVGGQPG
jgi:hypothetical protein